jgi:hypothetical protein
MPGPPGADIRDQPTHLPGLIVEQEIADDG